MRKIALTLALTAAGIAGASWANGEVVYVTGPVVYLSGPAAVEKLRTTNPSHYARAQKIIAAANHLCRPTPGQLEYAESDAKDVSCMRTLLRTSNPPKREIHFRLDDTTYIALVVVTDDPPRLVQAGPRP
ncbi:MAG TPA: hypothetical protein VF157_11480 [Chloroflexota bacterium]